MLIYLCEDSDADALRLQHYLNTFAKEKGFRFNIEVFSSGETLVESWVDAEKKPSLIFLDIYIEGISGVDAARKLRNMGYDGGIVFTTSSSEYAMDSYEVNALYYLHKPYDREDFGRAMGRCQNILNSEQEFFVPNHKRQSVSIPYGDILFFETGVLSHSIVMHTTDGTHFFTGTMSQIAKELQQSEMFIAVGRSFIVNLNHIAGKRQNDLIMSDNSIIQIPLRKQDEVFAAIEGWKRTKGRSV